MVAGTFVPKNFRSRERKFHRVNVHSLELSLPGTKVPWNIRSLELSLPVTFVPWNFHSLNITDNGKWFKSGSEKYTANKNDENEWISL